MTSTSIAILAQQVANWRTRDESSGRREGGERGEEVRRTKPCVVSLLMLRLKSQMAVVAWDSSCRSAEGVGGEEQGERFPPIPFPFLRELFLSAVAATKSSLCFPEKSIGFFSLFLLATLDLVSSFDRETRPWVSRRRRRSKKGSWPTERSLYSLTKSLDYLWIHSYLIGRLSIAS